MFRHAASSIWRRLTSRRRAADPIAGDGVEDERRVWVRHPADLPTEVSPADPEAGPGFPARVHDISQGGVKLLVDRPLEPGSLLTLTLPGRHPGTLTVLACVVHCAGLGDDRWAVGCNFSHELSDDDLVAFGAARTRPTPPDLRSWERYACDLTAACQRVVLEEEPWPVQVLNLSARGMALRVERDVPNGTLLSVTLSGPRRPEPLTILACVVHVCARSEGDRVLGCTFIRELEDSDLRALL
jgi:hypothetical protein